MVEVVVAPPQRVGVAPPAKVLGVARRGAVTIRAALRAAVGVVLLPQAEMAQFLPATLVMEETELQVASRVHPLSTRVAAVEVPSIPIPGLRKPQVSEV